MKRLVIISLASLLFSMAAMGGGAEVGNGHQRVASTNDTGPTAPKAGGPSTHPVPAPEPIPAPLPGGMQNGDVIVVSKAEFSSARASAGQVIEATVTLSREVAIEACGGELQAAGLELGVPFESCVAHGRELTLKLRLPDPTVAREYVLGGVWVKVAGASEELRLSLDSAAAPRIKVDGTLADAETAVVLAAVLSDTNGEVSFGEDFTLQVVVGGADKLVVGKLWYVVSDPDEIDESLSLPSVGFEQTASEFRSLDIVAFDIVMTVPARYAQTRALRFERIVFLDQSLRVHRLRFASPIVVRLP